MAKTTLTLIFVVLLGTYSIAQIPDGYYDGTDGLSGEALKAALHNIIKGHTEFPYSSSSTDTWDVLQEADKDPANSNNVIGIYSAFSMNGPLEYNNGSGWNREHVWAKSRGDFGTSQGAGTDLHHLRAADISTNSARSNRSFDNADTQYIDGSGAYSGTTESYTSSTAFIWEPRDEMKGDVARMIFYMATRYEGDSGEPDLELTESLPSNTDKSPLHGRQSTLIAWHLADPVSTAEQTRNDIIYSYQNNRNPYIDHPEYVCLVNSCPGVNSAPEINSTPELTATQNVLYNYDISTSDADGDEMNITAPILPSWLTLTYDGNGSSNLAGIPQSDNTGEQAVELNVSDGQETTKQEFIIDVSVIADIGNTLQANFKIYPNPTSGNLWIKGVLDSTAAHLEVFDMKGQVMYTKPLTLRKNKANEKIDLSSLENGYYIISIQGKAGQVISKKILLQR